MLEWHHHTARADTIFSHIYIIYLLVRYKSHWSFENYCSNGGHIIFSLAWNQQRWLQTLLWIIWKRIIGAQKKLKTNTETLIYSIWTCPQGPQGCQKMCQDPLNTPFEVWCAKIAPQIEEYLKNLNLKDIFFFQFWWFLKFVPF